MASPMSARMIGLFSIGALAILVAGILIFSSRNFTELEYEVQMVFTADVKGLNIGAPITYRGVKVGEVTGIEFYLENADSNISIVVSGQIIPQQSHILKTERDVDRFLEQQIRKGLKAQLVSRSLLTGLLEVQLDYFSDRPGYTIPLEEADRVIPTVQSDFQVISENMKSMASQVSQVPLLKISEDLSLLVQELRQLVSRDEMDRSFRDFAEVMHNLKSITGELDRSKQSLIEGVSNATRSVSRAGQDLSRLAVAGNNAMATAEQTLTQGQATLQQLDQTLLQMNRTLVVYEQIAEPGSELSVSLIRTLQTVERAAEQMRQLAETLERNPESLITGKQR